MNNKIFFSFMLSVFSLSIASETMVKQRMVAQIQVNNAAAEDYEVRDVRKLGIYAVAGSGVYEYPTRIKEKDIEFIEKNLKLTVIQNAIEITGSGENLYDIQFVGASLANLKKALEKANELRETRLGDQDFMISLVNQDVTKGVSFSLTEEQFEFITQDFHMAKIVTMFGVAGLIALMYYFNLHSKCMALLGRG